MFRRRGFTLVELAVVLVLLGLLICYLLPTLSQSRSVSRSKVCMMNMRTVGMGMAQYAGDSVGKLPPQSYYSSGPWTTTSLYNCRYLKANTTTNTGRCYLMKSFGPGALYDTGIVTQQETFYCPGPSQPATRDASFDPGYYTNPANGDLWVNPAYESTPYRIRSSYTFFKNNILTLDQMANLSYYYDMVSSWSEIAHKTGKGTPEGFYVLYGNGHVELARDEEILNFDDDIWGDTYGGMNPANSFDLWYNIHRDRVTLNYHIGNNMPDLFKVPSGSMATWQCNESISDGARSGQWYYSPN